MKSFFKLLTLLLMCAISVSAQQTFTVATLNVNGLPEIAGGTANKEKTQLMSQYLAQKGYDIIAAQEDFNYHDALVSALSENYMQAKHSGSLSILNLTFRTDTDGLMLFWKNEIPMTGDIRTAWTDINGNGLSDGDGKVTKGYRFFEATFDGGIVVDIYTLHMDAGSEPADIAARESQIRQLVGAVLQADTTHPKIIMGDTNCRYTREQLKALLIDSLNNSGLYTCADAWVETCKDGYPVYGTEPLLVDSLGLIQGEVVDKIIYINPRFGDHLILKNFQQNDDLVDENGEMLSDHRPMEATFEIEKSLVNPVISTGWFEGEDFASGEESWYIYNIGVGKFIGDDGHFFADINEATPWGIWGDYNPYSISKSDGDRFFMEGWPGYKTGIRSKSATSFNIVKEGSTEGSYNIEANGRYFNVTDENEPAFSAAKTNGPLNDWLFISTEQKEAYNEFLAVYNELLPYTELPMDEEQKSALVGILDQAANATYSQCIGENGLTAQLKFVLAMIKSIQEGVESVSAGSTKTPVAVYSLGGQRSNGMQKGLNIVRMSDGSIRKVMK